MNRNFLEERIGNTGFGYVDYPLNGNFLKRLFYV